jgi:hypothetical protein
MKKIKIDFKKLTDFSVFATGLIGLPLSWYVLYYLLGSISKYILVPWEMTLLRPSDAEWVRRVNDFFDKFPGSEIVPIVMVVSSILVCYLRWNKDRDYYLPIYFVAMNVLFGIVSYIAISLISKIVFLIIPILSYDYGFSGSSMLIEFKKAIDYYGYIKSLPTAIVFIILTWKYIIYLRYENINLFIGVQRRMWNKVILPSQPVTDMLNQSANGFRPMASNKMKDETASRPKTEPTRRVSENMEKREEKYLKKENLPKMPLLKPNVQGSNQIGGIDKPKTNPKIRLPIIGSSRPYIKVDGEKFRAKDKRRYIGKIKFFE